VPKTQKKLVFYVDTECSFSRKDICTYYSSKEAQKEAARNSRKVWKGRECCPVVYLQTGADKFRSFCPTRGGAWGEQLPTLSQPGPSAVRVELQPLEGESWEETVEKAAKIACEKSG